MKLALKGCVATMDAGSKVLKTGAVYIEDNKIVAVADAGAPPPPTFVGVTRVDTGGIIFPGLIELHNHLSYDVLCMWQAPKLYANRSRWQDAVAYVSNVSAPMGTIAKSSDT